MKKRHHSNKRTRRDLVLSPDRSIIRHEGMLLAKPTIKLVITISRHPYFGGVGNVWTSANGQYKKFLAEKIYPHKTNDDSFYNEVVRLIKYLDAFSSYDKSWDWGAALQELTQVTGITVRKLD